MKITITNIEVKNKTKLVQEMKEFITYPIDMLNTLLTEKELNLDEHIYRRLKYCENISFDDNEEIEQTDDVWYRPTVNEDGNIENKRGLSEAEKWFNSLSNEEKEHVKELSNGVFSNVAMA